MIVTGFPEVSVYPPTLTINPGCMAFFTCLDHGDPPGNFMWLFMGSQLFPNSSQVTIRPNGALFLNNVDVEDSGNYTCVVETTAGQNRGSGILTVLDTSLGSGEPVM